MGVWNPAQYERFKEEREQAGRDLIKLVQPAPNLKIVDLGCGTGELTQELHRVKGAVQTLGLDSSEKMLAQASTRAGNGLEFARMDASHYAPRGPKPDVIFSNACLMWVPGHAELFPRLWDALAP